LDPLLQPRSLHVADRARAGRKGDRRQVGRKDERRSAHDQDAYERSFVIKLAFDAVHVSVLHPRPGGDEDRGRVGAVQPDQVAGNLSGGGGAVYWRQVVAPGQARTSLFGGELSHRRSNALEKGTGTRE